MRKKFLKIYTIAFFVLLSSQVAFADLGGANGGLGGANPTNTSNTVPSNGSLNLSIKLQNPIADTDIMALIDRIVGVVLKVGIPIIALFLLWAGFQYVMARGNEKKITEAHRNLGYVLLGTAIFLGAYAIAKAIIATVNLITS